MSKILRGEELEKFIKDLNIKYDDEIFNIIISVFDGEAKYVINGIKVVDVNKDLIEKYL